MVCERAGEVLRKVGAVSRRRMPGAFERIFSSGEAIRNAPATALQDAEIEASVPGEPPMFGAVFSGGRVCATTHSAVSPASRRHISGGTCRNVVPLTPKEIAMPEPERIDRRRAALIAYDVCRRALTPSDSRAERRDAPGS